MSMLAVALISLCLTTISSSSSSSSRAIRRRAPLSSNRSTKRHDGAHSSSKPPASSLIDSNDIACSVDGDDDIITGCKGEAICYKYDEQCFILDYESDFEDNYISLDDDSSDNDGLLLQHHHRDTKDGFFPKVDDGNESIMCNCLLRKYSFRGGAAEVAGMSSLGGGMRLPGLHSGWRRKRTPQRRRRHRKIESNQKNGVQRENGKSTQLRHNNLQQIVNLHQQKMHQVRRAFRRKQREFHTAIYNLNSRSNNSSGEYNNFPKPPYNLWTLDRTQLQQQQRGGQQVIGKTTLTGKIFIFNIIMFGLQTIYPQLTSWGAKRSDMILEGRQLHRLLTPVFLHGGIGHLMANSYSLKSMGVNVEMAFGPSRLLATYLVSGIMGNVMSAIQSPNPAVGASGAIFGLVGAYYTFLARNQQLFGYTGQMQKDALIETIGFNLLLGMTNPMIDNWGHIGGFVGGVGMAYLIGPKLYVARVPLLGGGVTDKTSLTAGFSAGKIIIDRPTISFRTPEFVNEGIFWIDNHARKLGRSVSTSVSLFNGGGQRGEHEYYLDAIVDYCNGMSNSSGIYSTLNDADSTIYRTLKGNDSIQLEGSVNVTPSDGFRQNISELDPTIRRHSRIWRAPKAGHSIRPRYGHLYR